MIAEDDHELCYILKTILEGEGYRADCVHDGFALIAHLKKNQDVDAVILDLIMPEKGGISVFETIRSVSPVSKIIIHTGYTDYKHSVFAKAADAFVTKGEGAEKILAILKKLLT